MATINWYEIFIDTATGVQKYWTTAAANSTVVHSEDAQASGGALITSPFRSVLTVPCNPMEHCTDDSAQLVLFFAQNAIKPYKGLVATVTQQPSGSNLKSNFIRVAKTNKSELFSAGLLAEQILRRGESAAAQGFVAELKTAGLIT